MSAKIITPDSHIQTNLTHYSSVLFWDGKDVVLVKRPSVMYERANGVTTINSRKTGQFVVGDESACVVATIGNDENDFRINSSGSLCDPMDQNSL